MRFQLLLIYMKQQILFAYGVCVLQPFKEKKQLN